MTEALPRRERIRRRPDFLRVQQQGRRTRGRYLTLFVHPNGLEVDRLGIIATRRLGGATRRNRSKRLVREIYRHNKMVRAEGVTLDLVVLPRPGFSDVPYVTLEADFLSTVARDARVR